MRIRQFVATLLLMAAGLFAYDQLRGSGEPIAPSSEPRSPPDAGTPEPGLAAVPRSMRRADLRPLEEGLAAFERRLTKLEARMDDLAASGRPAEAVLPPIPDARSVGDLSIEQFERLLDQARYRSRLRAIRKDLDRRLRRLEPALSDSARDDVLTAALEIRSRADRISSHARDKAPDSELGALARELEREVVRLVGSGVSEPVLNAIGGVTVPGTAWKTSVDAGGD